VWSGFKDVGSKKQFVTCTLPNLTGDGVCGQEVNIKTSTSGMWNHLQYKHPDMFIKLKRKETEKKAGAAAVVSLQLSPMMVMSESQRKDLHRRHAIWLSKQKRPHSLVDDPEYRALWEAGTRGAYTPPTRKMVQAEVLVLSGESQDRLRSDIKALLATGRKLAISSDIWSDGMVSLFGGNIYWVDENWEIVEKVIFAEPFDDQTHTAENILEVAKGALNHFGIVRFGDIEWKVNDHAGNIMNGMNAIQSDGMGCFCHKLELCVKRFNDHAGIAPTVRKVKGITGHFSRATGKNGLVRFREIQRSEGLPVRNPQSASETRWRGTFDAMEYARRRQRALQLYDIDADQDDVYNSNKMDVQNWKINEQSCAVLELMAEVTTHAEGVSTFKLLGLSYRG
jgi:hypothetical protein